MQEEYKFKEEEYGPEKEPTQPEPGKRLPRIKKLPINKKLLFVVGAIVVLFIVYQFVKPKPAVVLPPSKAPEPQVPVVGQISQLAQKFNENSAKITTLQDELNKTQSELSDVKGTVSNLNTAVQELSRVVQQLVLEQRAAKVTKKVEPKKAKIPKVVYHVRAVVPGRAWLEAKDGTLITIRPGTKLNNYGTVTEIDAREGIVRTNLGFVIKYGVNDI